MKIWLRGDRWEVLTGQAVQQFPIHSDKYEENELIQALHLTAEGYPSPWGPAHAFIVRLKHGLLPAEGEDAAYRKQCRQATIDLLTLIASQFLGVLRPDEIPLVEVKDDGKELPLPPKLVRFLYDSLSAEGRTLPALVVLRDYKLSHAPIAAINYPDCLWFPVHTYSLGTAAQRLERFLGASIQPEGLRLPEGTTAPSPELVLLVAQLRGYLQLLWKRLENSSPLQRVLHRFDHGLQDLAQPGEVAIRSHRAFCWKGADRETIDLFLYTAAEEKLRGPGCEECKWDWVNHPYPQGRLVLEGTMSRQVTCPIHNRPISGWDDLMERGVFFDDDTGNYVIWEDDPTDEGGRYLQLPLDSERLEVKRSAGSKPGWVRFRFNKAEIEVRGRVVSRREVLLQQIVQLPKSATGELLPLNGEYTACVDWTHGGFVTDTARPGTSWTVHLRGGWLPFPWQVEVSRHAVLSREDKVTLLLWPGFEDPSWKAETVVFAVKGEDRLPALVRCYSEDRKASSEIREYEVQGPEVKGTILDLGFRVLGLEFRSLGGEPLGYLRPQRRVLLPGAVAEGTMALDFGTSHTVVAWQARNGELVKIALDQKAPPLEILAPSSPDERDMVAAHLSLAPFWPPPHEAEGRWCIPSELLFFPQHKKWTIPHEALDSPHFTNIRRDFKWQDDHNELRPPFLHVVLRLALANLKAMGIHTASLRATYPLSFESHQLTDYNNILETGHQNGEPILPRLAKETGMDLTLAGLANESLSGLKACQQQTGNLHCIIDFGGGTVDIAIRVPPLTKELKDKLEGPLFADSLRLAGNSVLDSLLADPALVDGILRSERVSQAPPEGRTAMARQIVLRDLRKAGQGLPKFWLYLAKSKGSALEQFAARSRSLFDGALAYALVLLAQAEEEMHRLDALPLDKGAEVAVYLVGQGWGLLRLQTEGGTPEPATYVAQRLNTLRQILPGRSGKYTLDVIEPGGFRKLATSFGALELAPGDVKHLSELVSATGKRTSMGIRLQFFDGSVVTPESRILDKFNIESTVSQHDAWENFVAPLLSAPGVSAHVRELFGATDNEREGYIDKRLKDLVASKMQHPLSRQESLNHTPLQLLVDEVWAEQLKRAGR